MGKHLLAGFGLDFDSNLVCKSLLQLLLLVVFVDCFFGL